MRVEHSLVVLLLAALACGSDSPAAPTVPAQVRDTISTTPKSFVPNLLTITVGSTVVFAFGGGIEHNAIFDAAAAGRPADILVTKDVNVSRTFGTRGTFKFDCTVHPGMRGEISVR